MEKYITIAKFTKPQGLEGKLRAVTYCDSPEILQNFERFYTDKGQYTEISITLCEIRKGFVVVKVNGVHDVESAERLVGKSLYIAREDFPLPENTWFIADLIGLKVVNADTGEFYGKVVEILQNAPKDVYVIKSPSPENKILMFPSIPEVLIDTNITTGIIKIRPLKGLFD
jgi:16S rRNA processing protein RimM